MNSILFFISDQQTLAREPHWLRAIFRVLWNFQAWIQEPNAIRGGENARGGRGFWFNHQTETQMPTYHRLTESQRYTIEA
ncbi:MAG: hypothetical protein P1U90_10870, partial [Akkermansiaceae bacterium]|nr:hypothetical protein [Akkermansiaceae bacterium]